MKEIVINITSLEIRVATLEDGELVEFLVEREQSRRLVGDIYMGKVNAILPGIQAAFVDIGYEKAGFLHANDLSNSMEAFRDFDIVEAPRRRGRHKPGMDKNSTPPIEKVLNKWQEILVQVTKESIGTKGPRLSTQISLPGRFVVYVPNLNYLGVSRRIESRQERARLKSLISRKKPPNAAIIARTACEGVDAKQIQADINFLHKMWQDVKARAEKGAAPKLIHEEVGLLIGMVRDVMTDDVDRIVIDSDREFKRLQQYLRTFSPNLCSRVTSARSGSREAGISSSIKQRRWSRSMSIPAATSARRIRRRRFSRRTCWPPARSRGSCAFGISVA
jgi:ribonuclease G